MQEVLVECRWGSTGYICTSNTGKFCITDGDNLSRYLKVYYPRADKTAEQKYLCRIPGTPTFPNICEFTLKEDETEHLVGEEWKTATICLIVLCSVLVIANVIALICCFLLVK
ncbi:hypothetical protein ACOMHN_021305 [Nucella lapillus]